MAKIFISYAREDGDFVRRLYDALEERGREAWVDWEKIPPADKWMAKIRSAIDEADAFVFVISPDSVASEVCGIELDYAIKQHKRLIPLVHREVPADSVPKELSELNYIFARDADSFDTACEQLITAIDTDLHWVQAHTRLLVRATEWDNEGRDRSYTLRGRDLDEFEDWLAKSPDNEPKPTALQSEYLLASRRAVTRRQRIVGASVAVGLSIAVGLGTIAYFQSRERERQETIAEARQLVNKSEALRDISAAAANAGGQLKESTRAAAQALATLHGLGIRSLDADQAVRKSLAALPKWIDVELDHERIDASAFDPTGAYLALFRGRERLMVWDTGRRQTLGSCERPLAAMESALALAVVSEGGLAATAIYNATKGAAETEITLWSVPDCSRKFQVGVSGRRERIALGGNGEYLFAEYGSTIRIWDVASGSELSDDFDFADLVLAFAASPDGRSLATVERDRGERRYWVRVRDLAGDRPMSQWQQPTTGYWMRWGPHALVAGGRGSTWIYDPGTGEVLGQHSTENGVFALSRDGQLVASGEYTIRIRDAATGSEVARTSHDSEVANLAFGPDNRSLITVDAVNRRIRVWRFREGAEFAQMRDDARISQIRFSEGDSLLYTATDQGASAWPLPPPNEPAAPYAHEAVATPPAPGGRYTVELPAATGPEGDASSITVRGAAAGFEPRNIALDARPMAASVTRDGERLAVLLATKSTRGGQERRLEVWDIGTGTRVATREFEPMLDADRAAYLEFAGDDGYLVIGTRQGVDVVDADRLEPVATIFHPGVRLTAMQSDATLVATTAGGGTVRVWDTGNGAEIARIEPPETVIVMVLSDDDRWLATLSDAGTVRLWSLTAGDLIRQACRWLPEPCP